MKYIYINRTTVLPFTKRMEMMQKQRNAMCLNEESTPVIEHKELVIENTPTYNEETQELYSWFEDGDVITKKFEVIEKEVIEDEN